MTLGQFTNTYKGTKQNPDGVFEYQCIDLVKLYLREVHGVPLFTMGDADKFWLEPKPQWAAKFDRIETQEVAAGDVVSLRPGTGGRSWHAVLAVSDAAGGKFIALEQNGSTGNGSGEGKDAIRTREIPTSRVVGVFRPKQKQADQGPKVYIMRPNDNMWKLETRWGIPHGTLQRMNPNIDPRKIPIGYRLAVPNSVSV